MMENVKRTQKPALRDHNGQTGDTWASKQITLVTDSLTQCLILETMDPKNMN